ncbi:MAG: hypothetical protein CSA45_01810 [Gammaproteobacteria bacterium]|nr:MAG: hypothetical protein CSA45_01810 [Gammaproteobacteria bacterium]
MKLKKQLPTFAIVVILAAVAYQQQQQSDTAVPADTSRQLGPKRQYDARNDSYSDALKTLWTAVYPHTGKTLYCDAAFSTDNRRERKKYVNAEHIYPMSWVSRALDCGSRKACRENSPRFRAIESDLHNIYPALIDVNKARSNYRFGPVAGEKRRFGVCDFEVDERKRIAEPPSAKRGEVARSMLYLSYQYQLPLDKKTQTLMRRWDGIDPPSDEERRREKIIHREQGRENPFIRRYPFKRTSD